jgi:hypothetical protein
MSYTLNQPANRWEDAIPTGKGPLGALVFGHVVEDWVRAQPPPLLARKSRAANCHIWLRNCQTSAVYKPKGVGLRPPLFSLPHWMR